MSATDSPVLELIELTKIYKDFWGRESVRALDALNLEVRRGEVFGLLGPNGSGKTTTVRLVLGLLFPSRGAVRLFGRTPREVDVKKRVGYMPEESHLYPYLSAEETLDFFGHLFRLPRAERRKRVDALIDQMGLRRAAKRPVGQYSKGMARRVAMAQALINDPDLLILDEPTSGIDPMSARKMKEMIAMLRERGKTIFLSSHQLSDVEQLCDRVCILYGGKQRRQGPLDELLAETDATQIIAPRLNEQALDTVLKAIREQVGEEAVVDVTVPKRRLEDIFMQEVEEARRAGLVTWGAEEGGAPAEFLSAREPEGEELLQELVQAGQSQGAEAQPQPEPVRSARSTVDEGLLQELTQMGSPGGGGDAEVAEQVRAATAPEARVREDVLNELLTDAPNEEKDDTDEPD